MEFRSHALCFLWEVEFKILSQREGHGGWGGEAWSGSGRVSVGSWEAAEEESMLSVNQVGKSPWW